MLPLFIIIYTLNLILFIRTALQTRLVPLAGTILIEFWALRMTVGGSKRLCHVLGQQDQQLFLIGFLPLIAAVSGEVGTQASKLTVRAVCTGQLTSRTIKNWMLEECKLACLLGAGAFAALAVLAFSFTHRMALSLAVGLVQGLNAAFAEILGSALPLLLAFFLRAKAHHVSECIQRAMADGMAAALSAGLFFLLSLAVSLPTDFANACPA